MAGKIYLVGTPIGNLDDITYRAVRVLKEVDLIAAEDTRHSRRLLGHFEITTPLISFHEHNELEKSQELVGKVKQGTNLALITDAGMPGISDPGYRLVVEAWKAELEIVPVPGPTAMISALVVSGMATDRFTFEGFLPRKKNQRQERLRELIIEPRTMVFYEAPHRLLATLTDILEIMGEDRVVMVARELTKKYEEKIRGRVSDVLQHFSEYLPKGELVIVIEGKGIIKLKAETQGWEEMSVIQHLQLLVDAGMTKKQAIRTVAQERGLSKSEVYQEAIQIEIN